MTTMNQEENAENARRLTAKLRAEMIKADEAALSTQDFAAQIKDELIDSEWDYEEGMAVTWNVRVCLLSWQHAHETWVEANKTLRELCARTVVLLDTAPGAALDLAEADSLYAALVAEMEKQTERAADIEWLKSYSEGETQ